MSPEPADANSQPPPETFGLTDDELAIRRTVFASDALGGMVVVVTGATGGIGRAIAWRSRGLARMSCWWAAIKPSLTL
jgi:hypothetical protein